MAITLTEVLAGTNAPAGVFTPTPESFNRSPAPLSSIEGADDYKKITGIELKQILNGSGARLVEKEDDRMPFAAALFFVPFLKQILFPITRFFAWVDERTGNYKEAAELRLGRADYFSQRANDSNLTQGAKDKYKQKTIEELSRIITLMEEHSIGNVERLYGGSGEPLSLADIYVERAGLLYPPNASNADYKRAAELYLKDGQLENAYSTFRILIDRFRQEGRYSEAADIFREKILKSEMKFVPPRFLDHYEEYIQDLKKAGRTEDALKAYDDLVAVAALQSGVIEEISLSKEAKMLIPLYNKDELIFSGKFRDILKEKMDYLINAGKYEEVVRLIDLAVDLAAKLGRNPELLEIVDQLEASGRPNLKETVLKKYEDAYVKYEKWKLAADIASFIGETYQSQNELVVEAGNAYGRAADYYGKAAVVIPYGGRVEVILTRLSRQAGDMGEQIELYKKSGSIAKEQINFLNGQLETLLQQAKLERAVTIFYGEDGNVTIGSLPIPPPLDLAEAQKKLLAKQSETDRPPLTSEILYKFNSGTLINYIAQDPIKVLRKLRKSDIMQNEMVARQGTFGQSDIAGWYLKFLLTVPPEIRKGPPEGRVEWLKKQFDLHRIVYLTPDHVGGDKISLQDKEEQRKPKDDAKGRDKPADIPSDAARDVPADKKPGGDEEGRKDRKKGRNETKGPLGLRLLPK